MQAFVRFFYYYGLWSGVTVPNELYLLNFKKFDWRKQF